MPPWDLRKYMKLFKRVKVKYNNNNEYTLNLYSNCSRFSSQKIKVRMCKNTPQRIKISQGRMPPHPPIDYFTSLHVAAHTTPLWEVINAKSDARMLEGVRFSWRGCVYEIGGGPFQSEGVCF